jgi:hypothetical protein
MPRRTPKVDPIDQRGEPVPPHHAGEEDAAENEADAEAETTLDPELDRSFVRTLGGAEQIPAVHPGRRHRQRRDPQRHRAARDDQIGRGALTDFSRRRPADGHKGGVHHDDGGDARGHNKSEVRSSK